MSTILKPAGIIFAALFTFVTLCWIFGPIIIGLAVMLAVSAGLGFVWVNRDAIFGD